MGTQVLEKALVIQFPAEILGPKSEYDRRRLALKAEYDSVLVKAKGLAAIETADDAELAVQLGRLLQAGTKDGEELFTLVKRQCDALKKPVLDQEKAFSDPLENEKKRLGVLLTGWNQKQAQIREEEERKQREAAEKQAREDMLSRAIELEQAGDSEAAEAVLEQPVYAPVVTPSYAPARVSGQVSRMGYSATVVDLKALVKAVADGSAPLACIVPDMSYINAKARLDKDGFILPGCKLDKNSGTSFRS